MNLPRPGFLTLPFAIAVLASGCVEQPADAGRPKLLSTAAASAGDVRRAEPFAEARSVPARVIEMEACVGPYIECYDPRPTPRIY